LFCLALASAFDQLGQDYAVLDGDGRTGDVHAAFLRKRPARWGDFRELRPESHNCSRDSEYESMLYDLIAANQHVIVNTPDGADSILMKWFDVTLRHTETNNHQFKFMYLISDRPDGLGILPQLAERFQFLYPVRNLHFGAPELFSAFDTHYSSGFHIVVDLQPLRGEEVRMLFDLGTFPAEALELKKAKMFTLPALSRARIAAWQNSFNEEIDGIIANDEVSNLKNLAWKYGMYE